jgi:hypothetical protein
VLAPEAGEIDLDAHLEQQQHDAHISQQLELRAIGDVAGRERRHREPDGEIADDRGEPNPSCGPARGRREQEDDAELEDRAGGRVHRRILPAAIDRATVDRAATTGPVDPVRSR